MTIKVTVPPHIGLFRSTVTWQFVLALILVAATVAIYYPVSRHQFVSYDDDVYVTSNFHVKYGLDWDGVKWAFKSYDANNWHPLTWLSHMLDCELFGINSARHHESNLLLHALNAALLFWVLVRATGYTGRSFMVAALFALHPINVESVAWVAERKNLLSMFFLLLALGAYRWYAREPRLARYVVVGLLFALGLLAKPQIITFPFVLLLWDYWPLQRMFPAQNESGSGLAAVPAKSFRWLILEKVPLLLLTIASAVVTMAAQRENAVAYPLSVRVGNAVVSYGWYVAKAFWPSRLALLYPHLPGSPPTLQVVAASLFLLAVTALVIAGHSRRYLLVGWFWFLGTLVPTIGFVQVGRQAMADRYAYLSFIGLFAMVCWRLAELAQERYLSRAWLVVPSLAALLGLAAVAHRQVGYWNNSLTLWTRTLAVTSNNYEAENNLGVALMKQSKLDEALPDLQAAAAIAPLEPIPYLNLGRCEQLQGNLPQAIENYQKVVNLTANDIRSNLQARHDALKNMGVAYHDLGDTAHAYEYVEEANTLLREYNHK
jgi:hypothetical protein